ncbi:two-component system sensor histidine kinase KdpD [Novosphingobium taihuense]|nr:two-component system sensor histidine kinase KdpD [Novosphingobium taihuense]
MPRYLSSALEALLAVAVVSALTSALLPTVGLESASLLFLLPVLIAATRGGTVPAMIAALAGAAAYNYFLLEPRFTFRVHRLDNLVSVFVLCAVAVVTGRLATRLLAREAEANERADASAEAATLAGLLSIEPATEAIDRALSYLSARYGQVVLVDEAGSSAGEGGFSSLDQSAAAWALHNGDVTGHGTLTMAAADWTFFPLVRRNRPGDAVLALARPATGLTRTRGSIEGVAALCLLIGQSRDRENLLRERRERELAEARDRLRSTFLASLAHDFRTPLTVIAGRLEQLERERPDARDALIAARRLDGMMANLLAAARIEGGSLSVSRESLDLVDVIGGVCDHLVLPEEVRIIREVAADLPFVQGDPVLLHHVLANLVDNALRHARSKVTVAARDEGGRVVISVEDDGTGVAEAERALIFERFRRIEGSDRTDGSGLGLAIVKDFADAMGMDVEVGQGSSGGARFEVSAPCVKVGQA